MITAVNYRPKYYSPGYNPIIFSVTSDQWDVPTNYDFKYVFDVYIDGQLAISNRFKQRPNPAGVGMIDLSTMMDPYLEIGNFSNEVGSPTPLKVGSNAVANLIIKVGEEYRQGAPSNPVRMYTGLGPVQTEGQPGFLVGAQGFVEEEGVDEKRIIVLPMSLGWSEQQKTMQTSQSSTVNDYYGLLGYVAPYVMKNNSIYNPTTCGGPGLFLSNEPRTSSGGNWQETNAAPPANFIVNDLSYDRRTVSFLNRNPVYEELGGAYLQAASPKVAWFEFYDSDNTNIGSYPIVNFSGEGGAPRASCTGTIATGGTGSFSNSINMELISLKVGPLDLEEEGIWNQLGEVPAYYTVQLFNTFALTGACEYSTPPTVPLSELVRVNIVEDCLSNLYPRVRVCWLNALGGRDYWNFTVFAEETVQGDSKDFYQTEVNWAGITPVELSGDTSQNWMKGGNRQYNKSVSTRWTITSDFLLQPQVELLKNIVRSSQTWAYFGQDDYPYMCKITEKSYTVKTIKQVKLFTATFNLELATVQTIQNP